MNCWKYNFLWSFISFCCFTQELVAQESSNKTEVYFATLQNEKGEEIRIEAIDHPLSFSVLPFSKENIVNVNRIQELSFSETITVNIDYKQMGFGGNNTWNMDARPHEAFRIASEPYEYKFRMIPLSKFR